MGVREEEICLEIATSLETKGTKHEQIFFFFFFWIGINKRNL